MPKKAHSGQVEAIQVVFRMPKDLHTAVQTAAAGLGLDLSNLLRMMIAEHIPEYIDRGRRAAAALEQARGQAQQAGGQEAPTEDRSRAETTSGSGRRRRSIILDTDADMG
jgi:hypothetical protein